MVVQNQSELDEDEVVHKELGDSLVRAATTASNLEAEQDSGNITKTRSKETPNGSSSLGTTSGGGPRCQETMGDTTARTRSESVSKHSNDSLLTRGNTLRSDEDRLKLNKLMELCTNLQTRVLDLEKTNTTQQNEIATKVESSGDKEDLGKDVSKQGSINAIDADEDITLVNVQDDADNEMFDLTVLNGEKVFVVRQNENVVKEIVDVVQVSTAATTVTITTKEINLAQTLEALKTSKPKVKGIVFQEPSTTPTITTISSQQSQDKAKFDKEERLAREKARKEKEANIALIEEWDDIQAKIDADHQLAERLKAQEQEELSNAKKATLFQQLLEKRRKHFLAKRNMEGYKLNDLKLKDFDSIQEMFDIAFKRQKVDDDKETAELKQCMEIIPDEEEVTIDVIPLAVESPSHMLKSFDRDDLEDLYKLVKARYGSTRPVESIDYLLWNDMKIIIFLDDAVYADLHVGREEVASYTTYTFNDVGKEASN
ncbi:hypothetical protein Tco_0370555 [Tanacetum coccineum]